LGGAVVELRKQRANQENRKRLCLCDGYPFRTGWRLKLTDRTFFHSQFLKFDSSIPAARLLLIISRLASPSSLNSGRGPIYGTRGKLISPHLLAVLPPHWQLANFTIKAPLTSMSGSVRTTRMSNTIPRAFQHLQPRCAEAAIQPIIVKISETGD
jgi:hypothetical protein